MPTSPTSPTPRPTLRRAHWVVFAVVLVGLLSPLTRLESRPIVAGSAKLAVGCLTLLALFWLGRLLWRKLLWRVGRRLAFSYFLVGVLPLGLIALLTLLTAYLLGGLMLGHLLRDSFRDLRHDLDAAAIRWLEQPEGARSTQLFGPGKLRFVEYRLGVPRSEIAPAPKSWPEWLEPEALISGDAPAAGPRAPLVALDDGALSMATAVRSGPRGVVVWFEGDLAALLRQRTRAWVDLLRSDAGGGLTATRLELAGREFTIRGLRTDRTPAELAEYFRLNPPQGDEPTFAERPFLAWMERTDQIPRLDGTPLPDVIVAASLAASPKALFEHLRSTSKRVDSGAWIALAGIAVLLFEIWAVAAGVALFMIVGLSRAVNRLSRATGAISEGDFAVRIPVRRKDQLGELQRSFNTMTERLEKLVHTAGQKEALDQELKLARRVQRDLLPDLIETRSGVEVATMFEPSAAIGGDYFDVLSRSGGRIAVVIADVAGHGLAAGLRMAMVKSALTVLAEEEYTSVEILERLHRLLRNRPGERGFVTLTISELFPATGELRLTNAGHPPCYVVRRNGEVEEMALPSSPLGGLPGSPAEGRTVLAPGDGVVWLSDGIAECATQQGEPFGFERIEQALAGEFASAAELRDRLLAGLRAYCGEAPVQDDRTLVVLRYVPEAGASPRTA